MIGTLVKCIDTFDEKKITKFNLAFPVIGMVYEIRAVDYDFGRAYFRLKEIVNKKHRYANGVHEPSFASDGFILAQSLEEGKDIINQINQILCSH